VSIVGLPARVGRRGLRVAIMTDETGWHTRRLQRALRERGAEGRCIDLERCHVDTAAHAHGLVLPGFGATLPDAVIVRGIAGGSFEQVTKRLSVLHALRELGVAVYNDARAIERSVDKAMTSLLLHAGGVRTPPTWVTESRDAALARVEREAAAGHAVVVKPLFGSQGRGVVRAGRVDGVDLPLPDLAGAPYGGVAYLQRFVPALGETGFDWRVLVIGGRARSAMRRVSAHWVHNVALGARCEPLALPGRADDRGAEVADVAAAAGTREALALAEAAERAAAVLALDYAGVDLMPTPEGPTVIEVNGVAAWRGLQRVSGFDIARAMVDDLIDRRLAGHEAGVGAPRAARAGG
jgi:glutathione synthase/RimK-type ligase-like ATP-grasp enzyme